MPLQENAETTQCQPLGILQQDVETLPAGDMCFRLGTEPGHLGKEAPDLPFAEEGPDVCGSGKHCFLPR